MSRYEGLPHIGPDDENEPRKDDTPEQDPLPEGWSQFDQVPTPTKPVSQWKLLKIIKAADGIALADLCWMFQIEDRQSPLLQFPLGQLLRAGRIRKVAGYSRRTQGLGEFFQPQ